MTDVTTPRLTLTYGEAALLEVVQEDAEKRLDRLVPLEAIRFTYRDGPKVEVDVDRCEPPCTIEPQGHTHHWNLQAPPKHQES